MTYPATPTYWLWETESIEHSLRRYAFSSEPVENPCPGGYHEASVYVGRQLAVWGERTGRRVRELSSVDTPHDDPRWPTTCEHCDYVFTDDDAWQDFTDLIYMDKDGVEYILRDRQREGGVRPAGPGAMWNAWWMSYSINPSDGLCIVAKCPNGREWMIDSRASNCTMPEDDVHRCWVRHGDPYAANLTVDKMTTEGYPTCAAGGGSIQAGDYHGFLQAGCFTAG